MFTTYAFSATWVDGATNWRGGGGPMRRPQQARCATAEANARGPEQATVRRARRRERVASGAGKERGAVCPDRRTPVS